MANNKKEITELTKMLIDLVNILNRVIVNGITVVNQNEISDMIEATENYIEVLKQEDKE